MIKYAIYRPRGEKELRLGFSVWARTPPKSCIASYPINCQEIKLKYQLERIKLIALVDDLLPQTLLHRTATEQAEITNHYQSQLSQMGFHEIYLVSTFTDANHSLQYLQNGFKITLAKFLSILPQSKGPNTNLSFSEIIEFLWHVHVLEVALTKFKLDGFLAGIRSEQFYLALRDILPRHSTFFASTV